LQVNANRSNRLSAKTRAILDIWGGGLGVISLQVFQNSLGVEALTREAAMIDALGSNAFQLFLATLIRECLV
jgi:hypothetical protein